MVLIFVKSVVYVGKIFFLLFDEGWDSQTDVTWKELLMSDNRDRTKIGFSWSPSLTSLCQHHLGQDNVYK